MLFQWCANNLQLAEGKEYFLICGRSDVNIWAKIKIENLYQAVETLWDDGLYLIDTQTQQVLEAGFDSRDEYNWLTAIYHADMIKEIKRNDIGAYAPLWNENREDYVLIRTEYGHTIVNKKDMIIFWIDDDRTAEQAAKQLLENGTEVFDCLKTACDVMTKGIEFSGDVCYSGDYGGQVYTNDMYAGGIPVEGILYEKYPGGALNYYAYCKNGIPHGERVRFYESGKIKSYEIMDTGTIDGNHTEWYENGGIKLEKYCKYGLVLRLKEYDRQGNVVREKKELKEDEISIYEKWKKYYEEEK